VFLDPPPAALELGRTDIPPQVQRTNNSGQVERLQAIALTPLTDSTNPRVPSFRKQAKIQRLYSELITPKSSTQQALTPLGESQCSSCEGRSGGQVAPMVPLKKSIQKTVKSNRDLLPNPHPLGFLNCKHRSRSVRQQSGALEQEAPKQENS